MIKSTYLKLSGVALVASSVAIATAQVALAPGASNVAVPNLGFAPAKPYIAISAVIDFTGYDAFHNADYTAYEQSAVWVDATTHDLDFYYAFGNTSSANGQSIFATGMEDYAGFTANVSQLDYINETTQITSMSRSANGDVLESIYSPAVGPGMGSTVLEVDTNAKSYTIGSMSFIDGGVAVESVYVPATPEPAPFFALGIGMIGLIRRRAKK